MNEVRFCSAGLFSHRPDLCDWLSCLQSFCPIANNMQLFTSSLSVAILSLVLIFVATDCFTRSPSLLFRRAASRAFERDATSTSSSTDDVYQKWVEEEMNEQFEELKEKARENDELINDDLPDYMKRMLSRFDEDVFEPDIPVAESKLPIIAIIGRPNTGLSLIVRFPCHVEVCV